MRWWLIACGCTLYGCTLLFDGSDLHGHDAGASEEDGGPSKDAGDDLSEMVAGDMRALFASHDVTTGEPDNVSKRFVTGHFSQQTGPLDVLIATQDTDGDGSLALCTNLQCTAPVPSPQVCHQVPMNGFVAADLDGDQIDDFVALCAGATVELYRNVTGGFSLLSKLTVPADSVALAVANFDGAAGVDIAVGSESQGVVVYLASNSKGTLFMSGTKYPIGTSTGVLLTTGTIDADSLPDLVALGISAANSTAFQIAGAPASVAEILAFSGPTLPLGLRLAHIYAKTGGQDLATLGDAQIGVTKNTGTSLLSGGTVTLAQMGTYADFDLHDLDSDGFDDLVTLEDGSGSVDVALNDRSGAFTPVSHVEAGAGALQVRIADVVGDSRPEVVVVGESATAKVFVQQ